MSLHAETSHRTNQKATTIPLRTTEPLMASTGKTHPPSSLQNMCWLLAACGMHLFQIRLMAAMWSVSPSASVTACLAIAWLLGTFGGRMWPRKGAWGTLLLLGIIASVMIPLPASPPLAFTFALTLSAFLGFASQNWLFQPRDWTLAPQMLWAEHAWTATLGLVCVWLLPLSICTTVSFACLIPLLLLDALWHKQGEETTPQYTIHTIHAHPSAPLYRTLSCVFSTLQTALWSTISVSFAAGLSRQHGLALLLWLLGGQLLAWGIACGAHRFLAQKRLAHSTIVLLLVLVVGGIFALSVLQVPLFLALSTAGCTIGNLLWEELFPTLMGPTITTEETRPTKEIILETGLTSLVALVCGLIADHFSIPTVLTLISVCLGTMLLLALWEMKVPIKPQSSSDEARLWASERF